MPAGTRAVKRGAVSAGAAGAVAGGVVGGVAGAVESVAFAEVAFAEVAAAEDVLAGVVEGVLAGELAGEVEASPLDAGSAAVDVASVPDFDPSAARRPEPCATIVPIRMTAIARPEVMRKRLRNGDMGGSVVCRAPGDVRRRPGGRSVSDERMAADVLGRRGTVRSGRSDRYSPFSSRCQSQSLSGAPRRMRSLIRSCVRLMSYSTRWKVNRSGAPAVPSSRMTYDERGS